MDDNFLYQLREKPDPEFVKNLYRKLSQNHSELDRREKMNNHTFIRSKGLLWIAALLVIVIIAMTAISPVRAFVSSLITKIAGLSFIVTENYPGDMIPGNEEIIEPQVMTLGEAQAIFPYDIHLPSYIPSGYVMNDNVRVYVGDTAGPFANSIEFNWRSSGEMSYILRIADQVDRDREVIAPDSAIEKIMLDDNHSAVLIRGGWNVDTQSWNNEFGFRLKWVVDNLTYDLMGGDREQLIEMALSTLK